MKSSQRIRQTLQRYQRKPISQQGILGNVVGEITVPNRVDYVYVRVAGLGTISVYNKRVPLILDLPVDVGYDPLEPKNFQVLNIHRYPQGGGRGLGDISTILHGSSHNLAGIDPVFIEKRQIMPLRPTPMGGMQVYITREVTYYDDKAVFVTGQQLDLAPYVPATGSWMVLLYKDTDELIKINTGGVLKDILSLSLADAPQAYPGTVPIALVRLYGGQSGIAEGYSDTDLIDVRQLFSPILTGTGSISGGHVIQDEGVSRTQRANLNFKGASVWAIDNAGTDSTDIIISGTSTNIYFNVKDYGAVGNGVNNDTDAVQDAIDTASVNGGMVWFPAGTYLCDSLTCYRNAGMIGAGRGLSIIKANSAGTLFNYGTGTTFGEFLAPIQDLNIDGNNTGTTGISITAGLTLSIHRVRVNKFTGTGIYLRAVLISEIQDCYIGDNGTGIDADRANLAGLGYVQANMVRIIDSTIQANTAWGIHWNYGSMLLVRGCNIEWCGTSGTADSGGISYTPVLEGFGLLVDGCWFEANTGGADLKIETPVAADQYCTVTDTLFVENNPTAHPTYGVYVDGSVRANHLICDRVEFYQNAAIADFYANGVDAYIELDHCIGTNGGVGSITVEGVTPAPPSGMQNPMTVIGDMIYEANPGIPSNQAIVSEGASASAINTMGGYVAGLMIDENDTTYWTASTSGVAGQWVKINLGSSKPISSFRMLQFGTVSGNYASAYSIYGSNDDSSYTHIIDIVPVLADGSIDTSENFASPVTYRYFKFIATAGGINGWAIYTIELFSGYSDPYPDKLAIGSEGEILTVVSGVPSWEASSTPIVTGAHVIMDEGSTLPYQPVLNFIGNSLWAVNNAGQGRTDIIISGTSSGGGHTIEDEGSPLTPRSNLNFVGASVNVTDDAGNDATVVTINNITGSASGHTIVNETTPLTQRSNLSFKGSTVWAVDNAGDDSTDIIISGSASSGGGYTEGAKVYHSTTQSCTAGQYTKMTFDSEAWDTNGIHDPGTNPTRLTCKTAGKYLIVGHFSIVSDTAQTNELDIMVNNAIIHARQVTAPASATYLDEITTVADLAENDYVELQIYKAGNTKNANGGISGTYLLMQRIG